MLLKGCGMILIIMSGTMLGILMSRDYEMRIHNLKQLKKMLILLKGEIKYNNAGICESIRIVSERTEKIAGGFLKKVADNFESGNFSLKEAWESGTDEYLKPNSKLKDKELIYIKELGLNLGITDKETQINNIMNCMESINLSIDELDAGRPEKCKMYKSLGIMAGAFIAIVLI